MTLADEQERAKRLKRIRRISGVMTWVVTAILVGLVLVGGLLTLALGAPDAYLIAPAETIDFDEFERAIGEIPHLQRLGVLALGYLWLAILFTAIFQIRRIFASFHRSDFFSRAAFNPMVIFGAALIALGVFSVVSDVVGSVLVTYDLPEGQRRLVLELDGEEIFFSVLGILMLLFGWTMREASILAEENSQFI